MRRSLIALGVLLARLPIEALGADLIPTSLIVTVEPSPLTPGDAIRLRLTVSPAISGTAFAAGPFPSQGGGAVTNGDGLIILPPREPGSYDYYVEFRASNAAYAMASTNVTVQVSGVQTSVSTPVLVSGIPRVGESLTLRTFVFPYPPNASISFLDGGSALATIPIEVWGAVVPRTGFGQITIGFQSVGEHSIRAVFGGVPGYSAAASEALNFVIRGVPLVSLTTSGSPASAASPITLRATVAPPNGQSAIPTGTVTLYEGAVSYGTVALDNAGKAVWTTPAGTFSAGTHTLRASYGGNSFYDEASASLVQMVRGAPAVALTASANPILATQPVTLTANVTRVGAGSLNPTGVVALLDDTIALGEVSLDGSGVARWTLAAGRLAPGEHRLRASYPGDQNYEPAASSIVRLQVNAPASPTATQLSVSLLGGGVQLLARVTGGEATAAGAVTFRDVQSNQSYRAVLAQGVATVPDAAASLGHFVEAAYEGDATHAASKSALQQVLALLNGFSFTRADLAADEIVTIFGGALASTQQSASVPLPAELGGSSAIVTDRNGIAHVALWYFASPGQATVVVPGDVPQGAGELTLTGAGGDKYRASVQVVAAAPGLATANADGQGPPAGQLQRVREDGSVSFESLAAFDAAAGKWIPAPIEFQGDALYLVLYGTGFRHAAGVSCSVRGEPVPVLYAGAQGAYPGLDQINLGLPTGFSGAGSVVVSCAAGAAASNAVGLVIR